MLELMAAVAAMTVGAPSQAPPRDVVEAFVTVCAETNADPAAALARADALGWRVIPDRPLPPGSNTPVMQMREHRDGGGEGWLLSTGYSRPGIRGCTVIINRASLFGIGAVRRELQTAIGLAPLPERAPQTVAHFAYAGDWQARQAAAWNPMVHDGPNGEELPMITILQTPGATSLMLVEPGS
jgi:hypothetical protein